MSHWLSVKSDGYCWLFTTAAYTTVWPPAFTFQTASQAVALTIQALSIFERLGAPEAQVARAALASLREQMGLEAFEAARGDAPNASGQAADGSGQGMTEEELRRAAIQNTVAVLKHVPERKAE